MVLRISEKRKLKIRTLLAKILTTDPIIFEGIVYYTSFFPEKKNFLLLSMYPQILN